MCGIDTATDASQSTARTAGSLHHRARPAALCPQLDRPMLGNSSRARVRDIVTVAALSLLAAAPAGSQAGGGATGGRQARDPMQEGLPLRPTRTLTFTTKV